MMASNRQVFLSDRLAERLRAADNPLAVGKVLAEANRAQVPHSKFAGLGDLPGHIFDDEAQRYRRVAKETGQAAVVQGLVGQALLVHDQLASVSAAVVQKGRGNWQVVGSPLVRSDQVRYLLGKAPNIERRARLVRSMLPLVTAVLASANPRANWGALPNGNLGAGVAASILSQQFTNEPQVHPSTGETYWSAYEVGELPVGSVMCRTETVLDITHPAVEIERRTGSAREAYATIDRSFRVEQSTILAVNPEIVGGVTTEDLDEALSTHGAGLEDLIVPAAGFVAVHQTFAPTS